MNTAPVKVSLLELLEEEPKRYSDIVKELGRPDKTVYVTLTLLVEGELVAKNEEGRYVLTDKGRRELERIRFVRVAEEEDDLEIISNSRMAIALARCYDLLFDLRYLLLLKTGKTEAEDKRAVYEKMSIIRNLLLKYNPSLKKDELLEEEKKGLGVSLADLLSGGIWWGRRLVKWGLRDRYHHLVNLTRELPESPAKDEIVKSLALFREITPKLDSGLKELAPYS